jgi:hypothetical protein
MASEKMEEKIMQNWNCSCVHCRTGTTLVYIAELELLLCTSMMECINVELNLEDKFEDTS